MKKLLYNLSLLMFLAACSVLTACSVKNNSDNNKKITGIVYVMGNVPFSKLTLKTESDSTFYLKCDSKTDSILYDNQGTKVELNYSKITDSAGIKIINVTNVKLEAK